MNTDFEQALSNRSVRSNAAEHANYRKGTN